VYSRLRVELVRDACAALCLEKYAALLVNVVNQWVILMNRRVLVVSIPGSCVQIGFGNLRVSVLTAPAGPSCPITGSESSV
jgi:hypothetical protein